MSLVDRACAFGQLAEHGPMTCHEVQRSLPNHSRWTYAQVYRALRQLERAGHVTRVGPVEGTVLWFVPTSYYPPTP